MNKACVSSSSRQAKAQAKKQRKYRSRKLRELKGQPMHIAVNFLMTRASSLDHEKVARHFRKKSGK